MATTLHLAQDGAADQVLNQHPFALLVGMMLDQQYPMEHAFRGPAKILQRFGSIDPVRIAASDPEEFATLCATPPAIHRYGRSMGGRVHQLATAVVHDYEGDASRLWATAPDTPTLLKRLTALPGFGDQKARIFAALLGKQLGVRPRGWRSEIGPYADRGSFRSVADVVDEESLRKVREFKKAAKAKARADNASR